MKAPTARQWFAGASAALALLAIGRTARSNDRAGWPPRGQPGRTVVPARVTGGDSARAWATLRHQVLMDALGWAGVPAEIAHPISMHMLAHMLRETTARHTHKVGGAEYNYNVGNIKVPMGWTGVAHFLGTDAEGGSYYRAYPDLASGIMAYIRLLQTGPRGIYAPSWRYLLEHPDDGLGWYTRLVQAGYSTRTPEAIAEIQVEMPRLERRVTTLLGG